MIEAYIEEFGEEHRDLIESSLTWLAQAEPTWNLDEPIDEREFIRDLILCVDRTHW